MPQHVHKYQRVRLGHQISSSERPTYWVFRCMLVGCPHYIPIALVVNRESLCNRCGRVFVIGLKESKMKKPHCKDCTYVRERIKV